MATTKRPSPVPPVGSDRTVGTACGLYVASYLLLFVLGFIAIAWTLIGHINPSTNDSAAGLIVGGAALILVLIIGSYTWYYVASKHAALRLPFGDSKEALPLFVEPPAPLTDEEFMGQARVRTLLGRAGKCRIELYGNGIRIWRGPSHPQPSWSFHYGDLIQAETVTILGSGRGPNAYYIRLVVALPRMAFLISSGSWTGDLRKRLSHHGVPTFGADS